MYQFGILLSVLLLMCPCSASKFEISPNSTGLTLQELTSDTAHLNDFAVQLVLHAGNHSLSSELMISSISELILLSNEDSKVICSNSGIFTFNNISSLKIKHLEFSGCKINIMSKSAGTFENCIFTGHRTMRLFSEVNVSITDSRFNNENSDSNNTMITSLASTISITRCALTTLHGRALIAERTTVNIIDTTLCGSIVTQDGDHPLVKFLNSTAKIVGCSIENNRGSLLVSARECLHIEIINSTFVNNTASECTLRVSHSNISLLHTIISKNVGNSSIVYLMSTHIDVRDGLTFSLNIGSFLVKKSIMTLNGTNTFKGCIQKGMNTTAAENCFQPEGTLTIIESKVMFYGTTYFLDNKSKKSGGALYVSDSQLQLQGHLTVARNTADNNGGGVFLYLTKLVSCGIIDITENKADHDGGGIYAISTMIVLRNYDTGMSLNGCPCRGLLNVTNNNAEIGGGMHLAVNSKLSGVEGSNFHYTMDFARNNATIKGGAIFVNDSTYTEVCASTSFANYDMQTECFFQALYDDEDIGKPKHTLTSQRLKFMDNLAQQGPILYGGLLDRCTVSPLAKVYTCGIKHPFYALSYFQNESGMNLNDTEGIASDSLRICFCDDNKLNCDYKQHPIKVNKGRMFTIPVAVVDQVNRSAYKSVTIGSYLSEKGSTLGSGQQQQHTQADRECNHLNFSISSQNNSVDIILYIEDSACEDSGLSRSTIKIEFNPCNCPLGFQEVRSDNCTCECHEIIKQYVHMCEPLNHTFQKKQNSWIGHFNDSGYLVYPNCPYDFCLPPMNVYINLSIPHGSDIQCDYNRAGLLCGRCKQGFQLSMGTPRCIQCSNPSIIIYVVRVLWAGISGIVMVALFLMLNLTVAQGTFNGLIFYANILLMSRSAFFPSITPSFFTIFIYLLNIQLGLEVCLPGDMDEYQKMWHQIVFTLYMLLLVVAIILLSKYSSKCAKIIGKRNPIATLATIVLLCYAKLLQWVIDIFSFAILEYSSGSREVVWRPDASVTYLNGKHIALFMVAVVIVTVGVIYTSLLFTWQWLTRAPNKYIFKWIRNTKLNSFMDAYHAPYKSKYRYWTGLLLFIRIMLNVARTADTTGNPQNILTTIIILTTFLILLKAYLADSIYKQCLLDFFETTCYFNLLLLCLVILRSAGNSRVTEVSVRISVSVTFFMTSCVLIYHIRNSLSEIKCYKCLTARIMHWRHKRKSNNPDFCSGNNAVVHYEHSKTEVSLSELFVCSDNEVACHKQTRNNTEGKVLSSNEQCIIVKDVLSTLREPLLEETQN